jgi:CelD/BcsL family acetyltransferase involved in cellulose biosynthesis
VISVRQNGHPVLLLPLCESNVRGRHLNLVGIGLADMATIPRATEEPAVVRAALSAIATLPHGWRKLCLGQVPASLATTIEREARVMGFPTLARLDSVSPYLPLDAGWEQLAARLSGGFRKELRNKRHRLEKRGDVVIRQQAPVLDFEGLFAEMRAVEEASSKAVRAKALLTTPREGDFVREFFRRQNDAGHLRVATIAVNGTVVAYQAGFLKGNRYLAYNTAFDRTYLRESPGIVLEAELIRTLANEGVCEYDFSRGKDLSKERWRPLERRNMKVLVFEPASHARLRYVAGSLIAKVKNRLRQRKA